MIQRRGLGRLDTRRSTSIEAVIYVGKVGIFVFEIYVVSSSKEQGSEAIIKFPSQIPDIDLNTSFSTAMLAISLRNRSFSP